VNITNSDFLNVVNTPTNNLYLISLYIFAIFCCAYSLLCVLYCMVKFDLGDGVGFLCGKKCCYLGDMLNGKGGANSAMIFRVSCSWKKYHELSGILTRLAVFKAERKGICCKCRK